MTSTHQKEEVTIWKYIRDIDDTAVRFGAQDAGEVRVAGIAGRGCHRYVMHGAGLMMVAG